MITPRVFIASNYREFRQERRALIEVLERLGLQAVVMESFGASAAAPVELCIEAVRSSDLVLALIGSRYGSSPPDDPRSFTHVELETALAESIPVIAYFRAGLTPETFAERAPEAPEAFAAIIARVGDLHVIEQFDSIRGLARAAERDIARAIERLLLRSAQAVEARSRLQEGLEALERGDLALARCRFFSLANAGDPRGDYWLGVLELLDSSAPHAITEALRRIGEAGAKGDARAQSVVKAIVTAAPSWLDIA